MRIACAPFIDASTGSWERAYGMNRYLAGAMAAFVIGTGWTASVVYAQDATGEATAQKPITLKLNDVDLKDALKLIFATRPDAAKTIDPDVTGTVSRNITNAATLDDALNQLLAGTGYTFNNQAGVYHVFARLAALAAPGTPGAGYGQNPGAPGLAQAPGTPYYPGGMTGPGATPPAPPVAGGYGGQTFGAQGGFGGQTGGYPQGGYPQGGYQPQAGYQPGGYQPGGYQPGGYQQAMAGQGGGPTFVPGVGFTQPGAGNTGMAPQRAGEPPTDATGAAEASGTGAAAVPVKLKLPPIRVQHIAPEYLVMLLQWLGSGSSQTQNGAGGQMARGGMGGQMGGQMGGMSGGMGGVGGLPPTESDILAMEYQQGTANQQKVGQSAQSVGGGMGGQMGGMGGMGMGGMGMGGYGQMGGQMGGYGQSSYGGGGYGQTGGYGNSGGYGYGR